MSDSGDKSYQEKFESNLDDIVHNISRGRSDSENVGDLSRAENRHSSSGSGAGSGSHQKYSGSSSGSGSGSGSGTSTVTQTKYTPSSGSSYGSASGSGSHLRSPRSGSSYGSRHQEAPDKFSWLDIFRSLVSALFTVTYSLFAWGANFIYSLFGGSIDNLRQSSWVHWAEGRYAALKRWANEHDDEIKSTGQYLKRFAARLALLIFAGLRFVFYNARRLTQQFLGYLKQRSGGKFLFQLVL